MSSDIPSNAGYPQYQVEPEGVWAWGKTQGLDGYSMAAVVAQVGWRVVELWGRDGWNLGYLPWVAVFHRDKDGHFDLALYREGDVTEYHFPTAEMREQATNENALFYWHWLREPFVEGIASADEMPEWLRGPYSEKRAREHDAPADAHAVVYHLTAARRSVAGYPDYVDTLSFYYDFRDLDGARRGYLTASAEFTHVVLTKEWLPLEGEVVRLQLASRGDWQTTLGISFSAAEVE